MTITTFQGVVFFASVELKRREILSGNFYSQQPAMKNTYPLRNQFNTLMIVQPSGINARINRLARSFCSKPLAEINGIFQGEVKKKKKNDSD